MSRPLRFYFDIISPYAYLAWKQLPAVAARHDLALEPVPILFAALLGAYGHKGPAEIPPKRVYTWKNVVRIAHGLGVAIEPPPGHPFNPLLALRLVASVDASARRAELVDRLFDLAWGGGGGVTDPERVAASLGPEGPALIRAAATPEAKARVRHDTEAALAAGVFGVPSFEIDGEVFWGQDSLPHLEAFLRGEDPASGDRVAKWLELPEEVRRPGA